MFRKCCFVTKLYPTLCNPWTAVCQAPQSMGFFRQEYWSGLPFPSPGDLPNPGIEPASPALAGGFFTTEPPGKSTVLYIQEMVNTKKVHRLHLTLLP